MNVNKKVLNSFYVSNATNIKPSDIFGQDSKNNADHVKDNKENDLGNFDAVDVNGNKDIFDKASVRFDKDDANANQEIFEYQYQRKNEKSVLPKRVFNKKKAAAQKKAAMTRHFDNLD